MTTETVAVATEEVKPRKSIGAIVTMIVRLLLGLVLALFGFANLFHLMPQPKEQPPEAVMTYINGLMSSHFIMPLVAAVMALTGLMFLTNRFVPLGLALITPILVGILGTHIFVMPQGWQPGAVMAAMVLYLAWAYRGAFKPMLAAKVTPGKG